MYHATALSTRSSHSTKLTFLYQNMILKTQVFVLFYRESSPTKSIPLKVKPTVIGTLRQSSSISQISYLRFPYIERSQKNVSTRARQWPTAIADDLTRVSLCLCFCPLKKPVHRPITTTRLPLYHCSNTFSHYMKHVIGFGALSKSFSSITIQKKKRKIKKQRSACRTL